MSLRKSLDKVREQGQKLREELRESTKPLVARGHRQATTVREQTGMSDPITTEAVVAIVGPSAIVVTDTNAEEISQRFAHPFTEELSPGDVVWSVADGLNQGRHLCVVRVTKKIGTISRAGEDGDDLVGSLSILNRGLYLHAGSHKFDMKTARRLR